MPLWVTPKVNIPYKNGKGAFGAGTLFVTSLGDGIGGFGLLYGSNTFGTRDKQFTLGVGLGYSGEGGFSEYPVINASGLIRTSKNWAFVTENYFLTFDSFGALISGGARYMGKRLAIDFGGFIPIFSDQDRLLILPWLSISVPFGKDIKKLKGRFTGLPYLYLLLLAQVCNLCHILPDLNPGLS